MAGVAPFEEPANYRRAIQKIRKLWYERSVDMIHLEQLVRFGRIVEHSKPHRLWRYKVEGITTEGDRMGCVMEINGKLIVITVITRRRR